MTTEMPSLCASCKNLDRKKKVCPAFPGGIPDDIMFWGGDHRNPWPGQKGDTVHELQAGKEQEFEDWVFTYVLEPDVGS